jgi:DNA polymerase-3 subunit beta
MEIQVTHNELLRALDLVSRVSTKHITLPVLQCVRIEATKNIITLQATNLELNIVVTLSGVVIDPGVVAVPAHICFQSIQFITDQTLTLRTEDQVLRIETKTTQTSIKLFSVEEFPSIQMITGDGSTLQANQFAYGIKSTAFAASHASIKPELGSIFIQQKKEHTLTCVATDSFRLVEKTVPQKHVVFEQSIMVPFKNAIELARVCESVGSDPTIIVNDNQCALRFSIGTYISTRLVTGSFPDYQQIIPKEYVTTVTVLTADLQTACRKTNTFLNKFRQVALMVTDGHITISAHNSDVGHTTDTIKAKVEGEDITLNFNQQYIVDPLSHITDESVTLRFAGIGRAMVMTGASDTSLRYLVMPMNK